MSGSPAMIRLIESLKRLPGIGEKSAQRLTWFLLSAPDQLTAEIAEAMVRLKRETVLCEHCFDLSDRTPCRICADDQRDDSLICVVEEPADLQSIERSRSFKGRYHVLGGALSPIEGVGPGHLRIAELERETRHLRRRLDQAETIIDVQKKVASMLGIPLKSSEDGGND